MLVNMISGILRDLPRTALKKPLDRLGQFRRSRGGVAGVLVGCGLRRDRTISGFPGV
jgi:hypothetical protein